MLNLLLFYNMNRSLKKNFFFGKCIDYTFNFYIKTMFIFSHISMMSKNDKFFFSEIHISNMNYFYNRFLDLYIYDNELYLNKYEITCVHALYLFFYFVYRLAARL